jgi:hypothetical protein
MRVEHCRRHPTRIVILETGAPEPLVSSALETD